MCLNIKHNSRRMTAKRDITVWKYVFVNFVFDLPHGFSAPFRGVIKGIECSGTVVFCDGKMYFCTDCPDLNGKSIEDKKGHKYSWIYDENVSTRKTTIGGRPLIEFSTVASYVTPYMAEKVNPGKTYDSDLVVEPNRLSIEVGLHAYARKKDVVSRLERLCIGMLAKCVIPKGSKYYVGKFLYNKSYASDRLRYVSIR